MARYRIIKLPKEYYKCLYVVSDGEDAWIETNKDGSIKEPNNIQDAIRAKRRLIQMDKERKNNG